MSKEKQKGLNASTIRSNIKYFGKEIQIRKGVLLNKSISILIIELDTKQQERKLFSKQYPSIGNRLIEMLETVLIVEQVIVELNVCPDRTIMDAEMLRSMKSYAEINTSDTINQKAGSM